MIPFRDENPTRTIPVVVTAIIAANIVISLYQLTLARDEQIILTCKYGAVPAVLVGRATVADSVRYVLSLSLPPTIVRAYLIDHPLDLTPLQPIWLTIFTSMFLHGGLGHLLGNMLYLWIFGNNVEDVLGHARFLVFYLLCGLLAAALQIALSISSALPMVGASGAIAGVLGAYYVKFPHARVQALVFIFFFVTIIWVPASLLLLLWFLLQLLHSMGALGESTAQGGVAVFAHVGGFLAGYLLIRRFEPRRRRVFRSYW